MRWKGANVMNILLRLQEEGNPEFYGFFDGKLEAQNFIEENESELVGAGMFEWNRIVCHGALDFIMEQGRRTRRIWQAEGYPGAEYWFLLEVP